MPHEYSLPDVLERIYYKELELEAAVMELTILVEQGGVQIAGANVRGALEAIGVNVGYTKQGIARLREMKRDADLYDALHIRSHFRKLTTPMAIANT